MHKKLFITIMISALASALILAGCKQLTGSPVAPKESFSAGSVSQDAKSVTMVITADEIGKLDQLPGLLVADLRGSECYEEIYAWAQAHPEVSVRYDVPLPNGNTVTNDISALNMTTLTHDGVEQLIRAASCLPQLTAIDLGAARDNFGWEDVAAIVEAFPDLDLSYTGELYGQTVRLSDSSIDLKYIPVRDGGAQVRLALRCMPGLKTLDMDSCGLSNEEMAAIRDEFPNVKVIWRVWFGENYSVRTDVEKILASKPSVGGMLTPENTQALQYCTDVKYLDLGHNEYLTDISFVACMPKLEVCILAMDYWSDATPLANCTNMEYLEVQETDLTDLSPLAGLVNLKHLNICNLDSGGTVDLSPLYGMSKMERLWIGGWTPIDRSQLEQLQACMPDAEINTSAGDPTEGRWRYVDLNLDTWQFIQHPRYTQLHEQFGYTDKDYAFYWNDPLYPPESALDGGDNRE